MFRGSLVRSGFPQAAVALTLWKCGLAIVKYYKARFGWNRSMGRNTWLI